MVGAVVGVVVVVAAGCGPAAPTPEPSEVAPTEPVVESSPSPSLPPLPEEWGDGDGVVVWRTSDAVDAEGFEEVAVVGGTGPDGESLIPAVSTLSADGALLVADVRHDRDTLELAPEGFTLRAVDGTGVAVPLPDADGVNRQSAHHDAHGDALAWMETTSVDLVDLDWRIVTSQPGGEAHVVADWSDITSESPPLVGAEVVPSLGDGWVAWNAPVPVEGEGSFGSGMRQSVMVAEVDGANRRTLDLWAATHTADGRSLYVAVDALHGPGAPPGMYQIVRVMPGSSDVASPVVTGPMAEGASVSAVAADGDALAWVVVPPSGPALLYAQEGDRRVVLPFPGAGGSAALSVSDGRIGWGDGSGGEGTQYLLDLRTSTLLRLGTSPGFSQVAVAGDLVARTQVTDDGRSSVLHIARLPR